MIAATFLSSEFAIGATPDQVETAIERGKAYLYSQQKNGLWEPRADKPTSAEQDKAPWDLLDGQWGGVTALSVYSLLASGDSLQDPRLATAVKFLRGGQFRGMYVLGVRAQLLTFQPPSHDLAREASTEAELFGHAQFKRPQAKGLNDYLVDSKNYWRFDHSVSQYGVLGMWACEQSGAEVPSDYWQATEKAWRDDQDPATGGWCYGKTPTGDHPICASMTAAGVATLFITQDYLHPAQGINCAGNVNDPHIDAGLKWMADNYEKVFSETTQPWTPYYTMYGVERIGVASGYKYFGKVDWFAQGADFLVHKQLGDGSWWGGPESTALSLLFLSRGRAPVVMNKLEYQNGMKIGNWNERPRDVANVVHWIARQTERDLNWQIVDLHAPVRELHDAPILYIAGNQVLKLTRDDEAKLKTFCEEGGIILANADCGNLGFANSFRKLGRRMFPAYEFRELPADHPIFTNEQYPRTGWKSPPSVLSLGNGVREMMILIGTADPARRWQMQETGNRDSSFQLADDIFLYSVDKANFQEKGKTYLVDADSSVTPDRTIKFARLQYDGNWDPEPGGWRRLAAILNNTLHIKLRTTVVKLGDHTLGPGRGVAIRVADLTGTTKFKLDAAQRQDLKDFVTGGGTLIVDAAGGSDEFAASAADEIAAIFGPAAAKQLSEHLPPSADLFNLPGSKIDSFGYRSYARSKLVGSTRAPMLSAVSIDGRPAIYFSRLDLSAGLVGEPVDGVIGYDPATATAIVRNILLDAAK
jgi:hypothetical protein